MTDFARTRVRMGALALIAGFTLAACETSTHVQAEIPDRPLTAADRTESGERVYARLNMASADTCVHGGTVYRVQAMVGGKVVDQGDTIFGPSACAAVRAAAASGAIGAGIGLAGKVISAPGGGGGDFIVQAISGSQSQADATARAGH